MADKKVSRIKIPLMFVIFAMVWPFLFPLLSFGADAKENGSAEKKQVIILLDCSQSMENVDDQFMAVDFIKEAIAIAPENVDIGVIAFDDEIRFAISPGCSYEEIENALQDMKYGHYGNAGEGLTEAVDLLREGETNKKILMISDGEIMMKTEEQTAESVEKFIQAAEKAAEKDITIDIIALGGRIEGDDTVYLAADKTNGQIYDFADSGDLSGFAEKQLSDEWEIKRSHVGTMNGSGGELSVILPDCCMERATIYLLGKQNNENLTINCKADKISLLKGRDYTIVEILKPESEEVRVQMTSEESLNVNAYLTADYQLELSAEHSYLPETGMTEIQLMIKNLAGQNLLDGHLNDNRLKVYLNDAEQNYTISDGKIYLEEYIEQNMTVWLLIEPYELFGNYQGSMAVEESVIIPELKEPEEAPKQIDWFFWIVIGLFLIALIVVFYLYTRNKEKRPVRTVTDESRIMPKENGIRGNDFCGKIVVYVIHNKDDVDYPPESINLFARCNREMITLEWILDACNLPIQLSGAEKIVIRPGTDKSLIIKNNSKGTALMGRELLMKGHSYHLYYHEKVTFIFDQEDTEIEVHYKDLKPNER